MAQQILDPDYDFVAICETEPRTLRVRIFNRYGGKVYDQSGLNDKATSANVAMYGAVNHALESLTNRLGASGRVAIVVGNDLVLKQLRNELKVSDAALKPLREKFITLKKNFEAVWLSAPVEKDAQKDELHAQALATHEEE